MSRSLHQMAALLASGLLLASCEATGPRCGMRADSRETVLPGLVLSGPGAAELGMFTVWDPLAGWEVSRKDGQLGLGGETGLTYRQWVEVRTRDHRWTINGRVRESSRTTTRTLLRGTLRSE